MFLNSMVQLGLIKKKTGQETQAAPAPVSGYAPNTYNPQGFIGKQMASQGLISGVNNEGQTSVPPQQTSQTASQPSSQPSVQVPIQRGSYNFVG